MDINRSDGHISRSSLLENVRIEHTHTRIVHIQGGIFGAERARLHEKAKVDASGY